MPMLIRCSECVLTYMTIGKVSRTWMDTLALTWMTIGKVSRPWINTSELACVDLHDMTAVP